MDTWNLEELFARARRPGGVNDPAVRKGLHSLATSVVSALTVASVPRYRLTDRIHKLLMDVAPRHDPRRCSPRGCAMRIAREVRDAEEWFTLASRPDALDDPAFHRWLEKLFARMQWLDGLNDPVVRDGLVILTNVVTKKLKKHGVQHHELWNETWASFTEGGAIIRNYNLRLMPWGGGSGVPTSGRKLVIVGTDNNGMLHIRIFDPKRKVTDKDETTLPMTQAGAIQTLKQRLLGLMPPHVLNDVEKARLIREATSIVDESLLRYNPFGPDIRVRGNTGGIAHESLLSLYKCVFKNWARKTAWKWAKGVANTALTSLHAKAPKDRVRQQHLANGHIQRVAQEMSLELGLVTPPDFLEMSEEFNKSMNIIFECCSDELERRIVGMRLEGMSMSAIAQALGVSERTVYRRRAALEFRVQVRKNLD